MATSVDVPQLLTVLKQDDSVLIIHDGIAAVFGAAQGRHLSSLCDAIWTPALHASDGHVVAIVAGDIHWPI
jgi:hypothetical protein